MKTIPLGVYKHYKGSLVEVIGVSLHSETKEEFVTYYHRDPVLGLPAHSLWVRPKAMFLEQVEVGGQKVPRFEFVWHKINTARMGVNAAIFNKNGEMLLEKRTDDGKIGIIGGWVDERESPKEAVLRELKEETALTGTVGKLVQIFHRNRGEYDNPTDSVHLLYIVNKVRGEIKISEESEEVQFMDHKLVNNWHRDHKEFAQTAFEYWRHNQ